MKVFRSLRIFLLGLVLIGGGQLMGFSEVTEIEEELSGELLLNNQKNIKEIEGKMWVLYYDVSVYPGVTFLKMAREQEDGSFEVMELQSMSIAGTVINQLDCTYDVMGEEVTIFFKKPYPTISDLRVYKLHSDNLLESTNLTEFSSQYNNIAQMSLIAAEDEMVLTLLRGEYSYTGGTWCIYYEDRLAGEFTGTDVIEGPVYAKDDLYIHQTGGGTNMGWPTFNGMVVAEGRIMDATTSQPAINSAPMDIIFRGGYIEDAYTDIEMETDLIASSNGFILNNSIDRDVLYVKVSGSTATCRYGDYLTIQDTIKVYNSFPDSVHSEISVGDSIWTNVVSRQVIDWDENTFTLVNHNRACVVYCELWLEGDISGRMSWICADTIYITGDLTYNSVLVGTPPDEGVCPDYLGVYSEKDIRIKYKNYDPEINMIKTDNCDDIYIYGVLAATGEVGGIVEDNYEGSFSVEYLHPHGSTPAYELQTVIYPYPDLNKFVYTNSSSFSGDEGFIMHSNEMPGGYPCCGYPYEDPEYGDGIITPYGADFPFYNPVYPESSEEIVFERGTIYHYGSLYERYFHTIKCNGATSAHHYNNIWEPESGMYGGTHAPCGYDMEYNFDNRLLYGGSPPEMGNLISSSNYRTTILQSSNGGDTFVQRIDQWDQDDGMIFDLRLQQCAEGAQTAFSYRTSQATKLAFYNTASFQYIETELDPGAYNGNLKELSLIDEEVYFYDNEIVWGSQNNQFYPLAELMMAEYYGYLDDHGQRLLWQADWMGGDLTFDFFCGDENWQFEHLGSSVLEYSAIVNSYTLEELWLDYNSAGEALLWLQRNLNGLQGFYVSRADLEGMSAGGDDEIPLALGLKTYPNPFNPELTIEYSATENTEETKINIFNIKGQRVKSFKIQNSEFKINQVFWDGKDDCGRLVSSGIYFVRMRSGEETIGCKAVMMK